MFTTEPEVSWVLFGRRSGDTFTGVGERHVTVASPGEGEIVRVRVILNNFDGDYRGWGATLAPERFEHEVDFEERFNDWDDIDTAGAIGGNDDRYDVEEWDPPPGTGRLPGDPLGRSIQWTVHPDAFSSERNTRLAASWQKFATAETLWVLCGSTEHYIRNYALHNKACPPDLADWALKYDHFLPGRLGGHSDQRRQDELNAEHFVSVGEFAAAARSPGASPEFLDMCARSDDSVLQCLAEVHPRTPIGGVMTVVRRDHVRVRSVLTKRFDLVKANPRWKNFTKAGIVAAIEHNLEDEIADALVDLSDADIADNFGDWGSNPGPVGK